MAAIRCMVALCLALCLVSAVSAWNDYRQDRRDSKSWDSQKSGYEKNRGDGYDQSNNGNNVPKWQDKQDRKQKNNKDYRNDGGDYNRYHHADRKAPPLPPRSGPINTNPNNQQRDWSNQQGQQSYCDRYSHDPYKHAKCQAKHAPRQPAQDSRCQKYVYEDDEPHKLVMCEQRAQGPPSQVPQCQHYEYDPYKLAKCERKAQYQGSYQGGPLKAPQCGRYVDDLYKLSKCEDRAQAGPNTQVPQCQQFAYDPYKMAKCEHKAEFWNDFQFDPAKVTATNPSCMRYAYDPYKMQRCEYKITKTLQGVAEDM